MSLLFFIISTSNFYSFLFVSGMDDDESLVVLDAITGLFFLYCSYFLQILFLFLSWFTTWCDGCVVEPTPTMTVKDVDENKWRNEKDLRLLFQWIFHIKKPSYSVYKCDNSVWPCTRIWVTIIGTIYFVSSLSIVTFYSSSSSHTCLIIYKLLLLLLFSQKLT